MNPAPSPALLSLSVPVEIPTPDRMEAIIHSAYLEAARERVKWYSPEEAANYLNMSVSTFKRRRDQYGLPASKDEGIVSYYGPDLDRVKLLRMEAKGKIAQQQPWPSTEARNQLLRQQPLAA